MFRSGFWRHFDFWLLGAVIVALVFGVTMILSAIAGNENLATLVPRQIIFGGIGFVIIILAAAIDYRFWSGAIVPMYIVIVIFLLLLFQRTGLLPITVRLISGGKRRDCGMSLLFMPPVISW